MHWTYVTPLFGLWCFVNRRRRPVFVVAIKIDSIGCFLFLKHASIVRFVEIFPEGRHREFKVMLMLESGRRISSTDGYRLLCRESNMAPSIQINTFFIGRDFYPFHVSRNKMVCSISTMIFSEL